MRRIPSVRNCSTSCTTPSTRRPNPIGPAPVLRRPSTVPSGPRILARPIGRSENHASTLMGHADADPARPASASVPLAPCPKVAEGNEQRGRWHEARRELTGRVRRDRGRALGLVAPRARGRGTSRYRQQRCVGVIACIRLPAGGRDRVMDSKGQCLVSPTLSLCIRYPIRCWPGTVLAGRKCGGCGHIYNKARKRYRCFCSFRARCNAVAMHGVSIIHLGVPCAWTQAAPMLCNRQIFASVGVENWRLAPFAPDDAPTRLQRVNQTARCFGP